MRFPRKSQPWPWDPAVQASFDKLRVKWCVLDGDDYLNSKDLESSPGECLYTGKRIIFERHCPPHWVMHELAHWIVCKLDRPKDHGKKNYGHETMGYAASRVDEMAAAVLTCALMRHFGHDWISTAQELTLYNEPGQPFFDVMSFNMDDPNDPKVCALGKLIDMDSARYMDWFKVQMLAGDPHISSPVGTVAADQWLIPGGSNPSP